MNYELLFISWAAREPVARFSPNKYQFIVHQSQSFVKSETISRFDIFPDRAVCHRRSARREQAADRFPAAPPRRRNPAYEDRPWPATDEHPQCLLQDASEVPPREELLRPCNGFVLDSYERVRIPFERCWVAGVQKPRRPNRFPAVSRFR